MPSIFSIPIMPSFMPDPPPMSIIVGVDMPPMPPMSMPPPIIDGCGVMEPMLGMRRSEHLLSQAFSSLLAEMARTDKRSRSTVSRGAEAKTLSVEMLGVASDAAGVSAERAYDESLAAGRRFEESAWPCLEDEARPRFGGVGEEVAWRLVAAYLRAPSHCALGASCARLYVATRDVVPGLRPSLSLYAHQRDGVCFMLRKERGGGGGRGGLLCDEPGMGKTLTLLSVVLRTAKLRARAGGAGPSGRASRGGARARAAEKGGTIIVAPVALCNHWKRELLRHCVGPEDVDAAIFDHATLGRVVLDAPDAATGRPRRHLPWGSDGRAPDVLITSAQRLSSEFSRSRDSWHSKEASYESPLLATAWLRSVVDEGQHAGAAAPTNLHLMLGKLVVERRWILTGTPTSRRFRDGDGGEVALRQHGRLLRAVREAPWSDAATEQPWRARVVDPLVAGRGDRAAAAAELSASCRAAVVRHRAADLRLPEPVKKTTRLAPSDGERRSLNAYVSFIKTNLLLTSLESDDASNMRDGDEASLLHASNRRRAREAIENILLCCAGGGEMVKTQPAGVLEELRRLLGKVTDDASKVDAAVAFFARERSEAPCARCGLSLSYLLVTPCACFLCPECVASHASCAACGKTFPSVDYLESDDADRHEVEVGPDGVATCCHWDGWLSKNADGVNRRCTKRHASWRRKTRSPAEFFAWLQPGVELRWRDAVKEGAAAARAAAYYRRKRAADGPPPAFGEALPLLDAEDDDLLGLRAHSKAAHVAAVLEGAVDARRRRKPGGDDRPVRAILFAESRQILDLVGHSLVHRFGPDAVAQHWGKFRADELRKFARGEVVAWTCAHCGFANEDRGRTCARRKLHLEPTADGAAHRDVFEDAVRGHFLGRVYSVGEAVVLGDGETMVVASVGRCGRKRTRSAPDVVRKLPDDDLRVLLLHHDGRHGLNLPFATHVFLLSTLWDPGYELQVVSRARRIGATGPVTVDQLLIRDTAEADLHDLSLRRADSDAAEDARVVAILRGLRLLRAPRVPRVSDVAAAPPPKRVRFARPGDDSIVVL